jgi:hypothetical protein
MRTTCCNLKYGKPVKVDSDYLALDWRARKVEPDERGHVDVKRLFSRIDGKGVYCFEGRHDAHPQGAVLYVGQAARDTDALGARMPRSFGLFQDRGVLYSDVQDLVIRWAPVAPDYIDDVESLLLVAHAPPFNAQEVRRWYSGRSNLVVLNAGAKGRLHPSVAAIYHCEHGWPNERRNTSKR